MRTLRAYFKGSWVVPHLENIGTRDSLMCEDSGEQDIIEFYNDPVQSLDCEFKIKNPSARTLRYLSEGRLYAALSSKLTYMRDTNVPDKQDTSTYGIGNTYVCSVYHPQWAVIDGNPVIQVTDLDYSLIDDIDIDLEDTGPYTIDLNYIRTCERAYQLGLSQYVWFKVVLGFGPKNYQNPSREMIRYYKSSDIMLYNK